MGELQSIATFSLPASKSNWVLFFVYIVISPTNVLGLDSLLQLPQFWGSSSSTLLQSRRVLNLKDYGAKGDGLTDDTEAFLGIWKTACSSLLTSKVVVPVGNSYLVHQIDFAGPCRSKVTLRISGTIIAPRSPDEWKGRDPHKWLYFHNVEHLTIEGGGIVNGMGLEWWARSCKINMTNPCKHAPTAVTFHRCKNLKVRNIEIVNSQQMHLAFTHCVGVVASQLRVIAPADSPNTDGIHISESTHVSIKHSIIGTGDDCISIVGNSSRIKIRNIDCGPGHGISIGSLGKSNSWSQVRDVSVRGAFLSNTENGVRIKTWQGGSGNASKITFRDVWMENVSNPIIIDQFYCDSPLPCLNQSSAVTIKDVSYVGIKGTSATEKAVRFTCSDDSACEGLYMEDIELVSESGGATSSFCWNARGSSSGSVYPSPCFSCNQSFFQQLIPTTSSVQSA